MRRNSKNLSFVLVGDGAGVKGVRTRPSRRHQSPYPAVGYLHVSVWIEKQGPSHYQHLADLLQDRILQNRMEWDGMFRDGFGVGQAGSNSWTNEPTDRTAGASSQIDARGSSWAPLFVHLLHPLYSLLTPILPFPHFPIQDGIPGWVLPVQYCFSSCSTYVDMPRRRAKPLLASYQLSTSNFTCVCTFAKYTCFFLSLYVHTQYICMHL